MSKKNLALKAEVIRLRRDEGLSIREIEKRTGTSKGNISTWVRDVKLTPEQEQKLRDRNPIYNRLYYAHENGSAERAKQAREKRIEYQDIGKRMARSCSSESLFTVGCVLYWAEGSKQRNSCAIANSDPAVVRMFKEFLLKYFNINEDDLSIHVHLHKANDTTSEEAEKYWLDVLSLPSTCLRKTVVITKHPMSTMRKKNKLKYGMCHLKLHRTDILQKIFGAIKQIAGIEDKELWLN